MTVPAWAAEHFTEGEWEAIEEARSRIDAEDQWEIDDLLTRMTETHPRTEEDGCMRVAALLRYARALRSAEYGPVPGPEREAAVRDVLEALGRPPWRPPSPDDDVADAGEAEEEVQHEE